MNFGQDFLGFTSLMIDYLLNPLLEPLVPIETNLLVRHKKREEKQEKLVLVLQGLGTL